jgi:hypothetical protein
LRSPLVAPVTVPVTRQEAPLATRNRKFESTSLQRRVVCEPDFLAATVADVEQRQALPT